MTLVAVRGPRMLHSDMRPSAFDESNKGYRAPPDDTVMHIQTIRRFKNVI